MSCAARSETVCQLLDIVKELFRPLDPEIESPGCFGLIGEGVIGTAEDYRRASRQRGKFGDEFDTGHPWQSLISNHRGRTTLRDAFQRKLSGRETLDFMAACHEELSENFSDVGVIVNQENSSHILQPGSVEVDSNKPCRIVDSPRI